MATTVVAVAMETDVDCGNGCMATDVVYVSIGNRCGNGCHGNDVVALPWQPNWVTVALATECSNGFHGNPMWYGCNMELMW
ncbi:hypothetical protein FQR65_LT20391 [Abscondita terminalis]|nr:hypothetical protein FQR65_LT20391 [Abscondita terminalis]